MVILMRSTSSALAFLICAVLVGCSGLDPHRRPTAHDQSGFKSIDNGYIAMDPIPIRDSGIDGTRDPDLATLTSIGTVSSQRLVRGGGGLDTPVGSFNASSEHLRLYADNLIYRIVVKRYTIELVDSDSGNVRSFTIPVSLVIGVGSRIEGVLNLGEGDLNVSGVPGFGITGDLEVSSASASVHTVGILSETLVKMPRFSGEITKENLYVFFQNLALINSEIYQGGTSVTPHVMGFYVSQLPVGLDYGAISSAIRNDAAQAITVRQFIDEAESTGGPVRLSN